MIEIPLTSVIPDVETIDHSLRLVRDLPGYSSPLVLVGGDAVVDHDHLVRIGILRWHLPGVGQLKRFHQKIGHFFNRFFKLFNQTLQ